ncbi:hypothetical protein, partial [Acidovorax sp.]|uniref:hypothetical protein n=1 Tax=Acidovorax sp. TaxID=1872122 RepID=UPI003BAFDF6C
PRQVNQNAALRAQACRAAFFCRVRIVGAGGVNPVCCKCVRQLAATCVPVKLQRFTDFSNPLQFIPTSHWSLPT